VALREVRRPTDGQPQSSPKPAPDRPTRSADTRRPNAFLAPTALGDGAPLHTTTALVPCRPLSFGRCPRDGFVEPEPHAEHGCPRGDPFSGARSITHPSRAIAFSACTPLRGRDVTVRGRERPPLHKPLPRGSGSSFGKMRLPCPSESPERPDRCQRPRIFRCAQRADGLEPMGGCAREAGFFPVFHAESGAAGCSERNRVI